MHDSDSPVAEGTEIRTYFVRDRNALVARGDFSELYVEYYLHLHEHGLRHPVAPDQLLKDTLAALTLHAASRPWNETIAWTINLREPRVNLFATAANPTSIIAGNLFTEDVRESETNLFYSDLVRGSDPAQRSVIKFIGSDIFLAAEAYYTQSEQRPARFFQLAEEEFVLVSAQPDCDLEWLAALTLQTVQTMDESETLSLLETRRYSWACGCSEERLMPMLVSVLKQDPEGLFGDEESIRVSCPRCGAKYTMTREKLEEFARKN